MAEELAPEIWLDPLGRPAELRHVGLTAYDGDDAWYAEQPGQLHPHTYEVRNVANPRLRLTRVVFPVEPWSPYDAISDLLVRDGWTPPAATVEELATCEHGLSAQLCAGPNHYPMEDRF